MKSFVKKLAFFVMCFCVNVPAVDAHMLRLGVGPSFGQLELPNATGASIFSGLGGVGDLKFKYIPGPFNPEKEEFATTSYDFFAVYRQEANSNVTGTSKEVARKKFRGGGVDVYFWRFFIGGEAGITDLSVSLRGVSLANQFFSYGGRAGVQMDLNRKGTFALTVTGVAEYGDYELAGFGKKQMADYFVTAVVSFDVLELFRVKRY